MKNNLISFAILILSSCSQQSPKADNSHVKPTATVNLKRVTVANESNSRSQDSITRSNALHKIAVQSVACFFRPVEFYEITEQHLNGEGDSILFVSENKLFKHPLGHFTSISQVLDKFSNLNQSYIDEDPDSTGMVRVHTFRKGNNIFKMFASQELPHELLLASGVVLEPGIKFYNKVSIGMRREDFIKVFFKNYDSQCLCNVYSFAYAVDSEVEHFTFEKEKLVKIQVVSNYAFK